ncbi:hypothetical protein, partial [Microcoleus sp. B3-C5]|uniref:hypothetical protein n=1 Tax=Microcoleus sp. B3-C5 TaxID=2818654 RepID=UPI002FD1C305
METAMPIGVINLSRLSASPRVRQGMNSTGLIAKVLAMRTQKPTICQSASPPGNEFHGAYSESPRY